MQSYLVETYVPASSRRDAAGLGSRARSAAEELGRAGIKVQYVRTTFLPDDETCFHLVEADSRDTVGELCRRAGIGHARITRAVDEPI
jgi:hypothetical protein